jgi:hypothetical protein
MRSKSRTVMAVGALVATSVTTVIACSVSVNGSAPGDAGEDAMIPQVDAMSDANAPDAGSAHDAGAKDSSFEASTSEASTKDASGDAACSGLICNGECIAASDCAGCAGATLLCAAKGACVSHCDTCVDGTDASTPIECFACDANHQNPIGTCTSADVGAYCLNGSYFGSYRGGAGYHCGCADGDAGDAAACPGATQVCTTVGNVPLCVTCGEPVPTSIEGVACKAGGTTCNPSAHSCE